MAQAVAAIEQKEKSEKLGFHKPQKLRDFYPWGSWQGNAMMTFQSHSDYGDYHNIWIVMGFDSSVTEFDIRLAPFIKYDSCCTKPPKAFCGPFPSSQATHACPTDEGFLWRKFVFDFWLQNTWGGPTAMLLTVFTTQGVIGAASPSLSLFRLIPTQTISCLDFPYLELVIHLAHRTTLHSWENRRDDECSTGNDEI